MHFSKRRLAEMLERLRIELDFRGSRTSYTSRYITDALLTYKVNWNNRNRNGIGNGNGSHDEESGSRTMHIARGCTYKEFLNCQPRNFKGTEEADIALTWWNTHMKTVRIDAAYEMSWKELMKMMTKVYCLRNEIQRMESKLMVLDEEKKIERYIWVLLDNIQGNVTSAEPTRFQDAIRLANSLMDQMVRAIDARQDENKRRWKNNRKDNHVKQPPPKRHNIARAYTAGPKEKREYAGNLPLCNKCRLHHTGSCTAKFGICKRVGHMTMDCRSPAAATNQRALVAN
ncbi:hypothetical protein Tco_0045990 [Tanacetum coccineum]